MHLGSSYEECGFATSHSKPSTAYKPDQSWDIFIYHPASKRDVKIKPVSCHCKDFHWNQRTKKQQPYFWEALGHLNVGSQATVSHASKKVLLSDNAPAMQAGAEMQTAASTVQTL